MPVELYSLERYLSISKEKILKEVSRNRIIEKNKFKRTKEEIIKSVEKSVKENLFMETL